LEARTIHHRRASVNSMNVPFLSIWRNLLPMACLASCLGIHPSPTQTPTESIGQKPTLADLLGFLDRDSDGSIDAFEGAEGFLFLTELGDTNNDQALSFAEVERYLLDSKVEELTEREEHFREFDANQDGQLTSDEVPEELQGIFVSADSNADQRLSLDELLKAEGRDDPRAMFEQEVLGFLAELDEDGDGAFALSDMLLLDRIQFAPQFKALDINGDSLVDKEEILALVGQELRAAAFEIRGRDAIMTGVIGPTTPGRVLELLVEHPEVERVVMEDVPGSMDDVSMLRAAKILRRGRLETHVPADGEVASGGTDFFQAGVLRTKGKGARFGVHSWSGGPDQEGAGLPKSDEEHVKYLDYYRAMGIPEAFYWYTLKAAPADGIHWMTEEELSRFDMLTPDSKTEVSRQAEASPMLLGGCILREPQAQAPSNLHRVTPVIATKEYGPLPKMLRACGITLAAEKAVPDAFLELVGQTVLEIFEETKSTDTELQDRVLTHLYAYRALLPVPINEETLEELIDSSHGDFERIERGNSLCDIIMSDVPEGQVMEVIEHILHAVTDVGLHYAFPKEWGISHESELWKTMHLAIERGHYSVESYSDLKQDAPTEVYDRILLQEFAYWFISTAWDLQEAYGPDETEWSIRTPSQLQALYPEFWQVYEQTAGRVMQPPTMATLKEIGPTRSEERER
jgi:hypothetical protein